MKIIVINRIGSLFFVLLWIPFPGWSQTEMDIKVILVDFSEEGFEKEQLPPLENEEPEIFDTMVKAVFRQPTNAETMLFATDNLDPGHHLWNVQLKEISWRRKFLVLW